MRVLFYAKSEADARLAHGLALDLRRRGVADRFAAVVYRESGEGWYMRRRTNGLFGRVISESEMYREAKESGFAADDDDLKRLESLYGAPTLWQFVTHDRLLSMKRRGYLYQQGTRFTRRELLGHLVARFKLTERMIEEFEPDLVMYAGVDTGPSSALILYAVAKARGIDVLAPMHTRIGSYMTLVDTVYSESASIRRSFESIRAAGGEDPARVAGQEVLDLFREGRLKPAFMKRFVADGEKGTWDPSGRQDTEVSGGTNGARRLVERVAARFERGKAGDPLYVSWWKRRFDDGVMAIRRRRLVRSGLFEDVPAKRKFVYFPLHVEPEMTLLLYAPYFTDQVTVVRNIAQSLPHDICLCVKEHPALFGSRSVADYERMAAIPNIRLLSPFADSHQLINGAEGVVTITGTVGLEAMLYGRPVITLGEVYYNFLSDLVWNTRSFVEMPALLERFRDHRSEDDLIVDFLAAVIRNSLEIDLRGLAIGLLRIEPDEALDHPEFRRWADFVAENIGVSRSASGD